MTVFRIASAAVFLLLAAAPAEGQGPLAGSSEPAARVGELIVVGTITGRVTEAASGRPIAGAQVAVANARVVTDADGRYTLSGVPEGTHTIRVSAIGHAPATHQVTVVTGRTLTLDLRLAAQVVELEGIVAVGYGTQRRSDVTGSIASVSSERLERVPTTSVEQVLQAALPGVSVTTSSSGAEEGNEIVIRGRNSIRASNAPLVVIDGMPYNGPLSEINQNDVASIDVLKDASSAAIYGARGANGVILITTRKGVQGKPRLGYRGHVGIQEAVNLPRLMTGPEWARWRCDLLAGGRDCEQRIWTLSERQGLAEGRSTDWIDLALRRGYQQQHNVSFSGGAEGTRYYVSGSLLDVNGIAKNDRFLRPSLRVNLDQKISSWLDMGTSSHVSLSDRSGSPASFQSAFFMSPLGIPYGADGDPTVFPWPEDPFFSNPLQGLVSVSDDRSRRLISNSYLQVGFPFLAGLSYRLNGGIEFSARDEGQYYGRNTAEGFGSRGKATVRNTTSTEWTVENIARYGREIGKHTFDLTALYSAQASEWEMEGLESAGFPNDVLTYYQAHLAAGMTPSSSITEWGMVSQMGRFNYTYDGRYLLTLTTRRDGFSGFGANRKYGVFPSVALGWSVSNEAFWPEQDALSSLKLRLSYGENGNQAVGAYQTLARMSPYSYLENDATAPGFIPTSLANPELRWETTTSTNLGADFGLFGDRVRGTLDAYTSTTHDLLLDRQISAVHGITRVTQNIGRVGNRGVELSFTSQNVETPDFSWSSNFSISANRNKILSLYGNGEDDVVNRWFVGKPISVNYDYIFAGVWQVGDDIASSAQPKAQPGDVRYADLNSDGKITDADRGFIGDRDADYVAGLNNTLRYRGVSLDFFLHSVQGPTRVNGLLHADHFQGRRNMIVLPYWTPENPSNTFPANRLTANPLATTFYTFFYEDASFIRLKDATLSFDLPAALGTRLGAESLRLYVNGRNLWTSTEWTGLDPELEGQMGIPLQRTFSAGVNLAF